MVTALCKKCAQIDADVFGYYINEYDYINGRWEIMF